MNTLEKLMHKLRFEKRSEHDAEFERDRLMTKIEELIEENDGQAREARSEMSRLELEEKAILKIAHAARKDEKKKLILEDTLRQIKLIRMKISNWENKARILTKNASDFESMHQKLDNLTVTNLMNLKPELVQELQADYEETMRRFQEDTQDMSSSLKDFQTGSLHLDRDADLKKLEEEILGPAE